MREKKVGTASPLFVKSDEKWNALVAKAAEIEAQAQGRSANKSDFARDAINKKIARMARRSPELRELIARQATA